MDVTYLAETCLKLRGREGSVLLAPTPAVMTQEADLALLCEPNGDVPPRLRVGHALSAPGEFEFGGILATAFGTYTEAPGPRAERNLIWVVEIDGIRTCHLGRLGHALSKDEIDLLGTVHVLMVPVGFRSSLKPDQVNDMISEFDPHYVIPYTHDAVDATGIRRAAGKMMSELGLKDDELRPKLAVNRSALGSGSGANVVLLEPRKG